jgi:hypothetical protein
MSLLRFSKDHVNVTCTCGSVTVDANAWHGMSEPRRKDIINMAADCSCAPKKEAAA